MKIKILRWIALAVGSLVNVWLLQFVIIIGAYFFGDLFDHDGKPFELDPIDIIVLFSMLLSVVSTVIAWFKSKIGSLLITLSAIILIIENASEVILRAEWPYYALLFSGLLLLFYAYSNNWRSQIKK